MPVARNRHRHFLFLSAAASCSRSSAPKRSRHGAGDAARASAACRGATHDVKIAHRYPGCRRAGRATPPQIRQAAVWRSQPQHRARVGQDGTLACSAINARFTALKLREAPAPTYRLLREDRVQSVCARQSPLSPLSLGRIGEQDSSGGGRCRRSSCEAWSAASFFPTSRYANREGRQRSAEGRARSAREGRFIFGLPPRVQCIGQS